MKVWEIWAFVILLWIVGAIFIYNGLMGGGYYYPQPAFFAGVCTIGVSIILLFLGGFIKAEREYGLSKSDKTMIICNYCHNSFLSPGIGSETQGMTVNCTHCAKPIRLGKTVLGYERIFLGFKRWRYKDIAIVAVTIVTLLLSFSLINLRLLPWLPYYVSETPAFFPPPELPQLLLAEGVFSIIIGIMFLVGTYSTMDFFEYTLIRRSAVYAYSIPKPSVRFGLAFMIAGVLLIVYYFLT